MKQRGMRRVNSRASRESEPESLYDATHAPLQAAGKGPKRKEDA